MSILGQISELSKPRKTQLSRKRLLCVLFTSTLIPSIDPQPQENFKLRDQNDDLNAEILSLSLYEAKNLFSCQTKAQCLAAEIDNASKDEVRIPRYLFHPVTRSLRLDLNSLLLLPPVFCLPPPSLSWWTP